MSTVTIILTDDDDSDEVNVKVEFGGDGANLREPSTPAQYMALRMLNFAVQSQSEEEDE